MATIEGRDPAPVALRSDNDRGVGESQREVRVPLNERSNASQ
jgi:hypothetical protein